MTREAAATSRVKSLAEGAAYAGSLRAAGRRVVFTNGVFDLLHPGHLRYLQQARALGDALIVGLNADVSVRRNKGPHRPINDEQERAEILAALECVDAVVIFGEDTPADIIRAIQPDILVKGADWAEDAIVGRDTVEVRGGQVVRIAIEAGFSTTAIIKKIKALPSPTVKGVTAEDAKNAE
jgi:D-beta-D-heptose 7-phosphate kinase/D-beta-D-heptose 1-phosphate adenosyltransferase